MARDADRQRASWPYPPTDLERLAERAGLGDDELRSHLRREIAKRRGEVVGVESATEAIDWAELLRYNSPAELAPLVRQFGDPAVEQFAVAVAALQ